MTSYDSPAAANKLPSDFEDALTLIRSLSPEERTAMGQTVSDGQDALLPQAGPQTEALASDADVLLYGGAAGGGKTYLAIIAALTRHMRTLIIRKEAAQLYALQDEIGDILGSRDGFNSQTGIWRLPPSRITDPLQLNIKRQIRFGGLNKPGDAKKYQGAARDLLIIDEAANVSFEEFTFLTVWSRSAIKGQRTRIILASNPPTDSVGMWLVNMFRPWLDPDHENPAKPGELRYFVTIDDEDIEADGPEDIIRDGETYSPESRTFIPAKVDDNQYLMDTGYKQKLQSLPKYLRERMLHGHFLSHLSDDEMQVIPSEWIQAAMDRWKKGKESSLMISMGVDPSRGGADEMVISTRHGQWFAPLIKIAGREVPDGPTAAARVMMARRDGAPIMLDAIGIGSSVLDKLNENEMDVTPMISNSKTEEMCDKGIFKFRNMRALWWWRLREALDPESGNQIALPPDKKLKADLAAFTYVVKDGGIIQVESKKEAKLRLGRSPDAGDAVVYANASAISIHLPRRGSMRYGVKKAIGGKRR